MRATTEVYKVIFGIWTSSVFVWSHKRKSKERVGIATGWPQLNKKKVILMLRVRVWVLREYYIWTKNHVQWMSQIKKD